MLRVISTFSGCGGSSLGYQLAGLKVALACEIDDNAVATYRRNFPGTPVYHGDVAQLTGAQARRLAGLADGDELDVLDGSPPCQGFSRMSGRHDPGDQRNQLFREYARLLRELRPRAFVMENVPGMAMGKMRPIFDEVMATLRGCGYAVSARILNAMWYGVPQSRERMIFLGVRADLGAAPTHPTFTVRQPVTAGEALRGVVIRDMPPRLAPSYHAIWARVRPGRTVKQDVMLRIGADTYYGTCKVDPNRPSQTICKMVGVRGFATPLHWAEPRCLATEEAQRLASFPDDFVFLGAFKERWARIGNCVPPLLMRAIGAELRRTLGDGDAADAITPGRISRPGVMLQA